MTAKRVLVRP